MHPSIHLLASDAAEHQLPRASIHPSIQLLLHKQSISCLAHPSLHPAAAPQAEHQLPRMCS
jgi:hypothetical protein